MKKSVISILAMNVCCAVSCSVAVAQKNDQHGKPNRVDGIARELESLDRKLNEAFAGRNIPALAEILAEDWHGPPSSGAAFDKAGTLEGIRQIQVAEAAEIPRPDTKIRRLYNVTVHIYGDAATVTGHFTLNDQGADPVWAYSYLNVFMRRKGRWQAVARLVSLAGPTPPPAKNGGLIVMPPDRNTGPPGQPRKPNQ